MVAMYTMSPSYIEQARLLEDYECVIYEYSDENWNDKNSKHDDHLLYDRQILIKKIH